MPVEVILPKVDMDMTHGTLATWHVAEGELVKQGEALFDIETDKAAMEVEAPASGRLHKISAKPGDVVAVGTTIALLYADGEAVEHAASPQTEKSFSKPDRPEIAANGPAPIEVILPKVDMDMTHGTLAKWHAAEGEAVKQGAPLFDIETDKAAMEVEAPASGILHQISANPGDKIAVGSVIAWIYPEGATVGAPQKSVGVLSDAVPATTHTEALASYVEALTFDQVATSTFNSIAATGDPIGARATPAAKTALRNAGFAVSDVLGTGPLGRVQKDDVLAFLEARQKATPANTTSSIWQPEAGPLYVSQRKGRGIPIVLIHGFAADSQSWAPLEKALSKDIPLIRIDLPGHGRSPKKKIDGFAQLARLMVEAFDNATREFEQVHVLAHSLGGALALSIADIRSRKIASLNLLAPAGLGPEINASALKGIGSASQVESLAPWLRQLTADPEAISDDYARAAMKLRTDEALRACQTDMASSLFPDGTQAFDLRPALNRLEMPIQILWGKQDQILPKQQAFAGKTDVGVFLLDKAGHIPHFECPERVAKIVSRLIFFADPVFQGAHTRED